MRKWLRMVIALCLLLTSVGCSSGPIPKSEFDRLLNQNAALKSQLTFLQEEAKKGEKVPIRIEFYDDWAFVVPKQCETAPTESSGKTFYFNKNTYFSINKITGSSFTEKGLIQWVYDLASQMLVDGYMSDPSVEHVTFNGLIFLNLSGYIRFNDGIYNTEMYFILRGNEMTYFTFNQINKIDNQYRAYITMIMHSARRLNVASSMPADSSSPDSNDDFLDSVASSFPSHKGDVQDSADSSADVSKDVLPNFQDLEEETAPLQIGDAQNPAGPI